MLSRVLSGGESKRRRKKGQKTPDLKYCEIPTRNGTCVPHCNHCLFPSCHKERKRVPSSKCPQCHPQGSHCPPPQAEAPTAGAIWTRCGLDGRAPPASPQGKALPDHPLKAAFLGNHWSTPCNHSPGWRMEFVLLQVLHTQSLPPCTDIAAHPGAQCPSVLLLQPCSCASLPAPPYFSARSQPVHPDPHMFSLTPRVKTPKALPKWWSLGWGHPVQQQGSVSCSSCPHPSHGDSRVSAYWPLAKACPVPARNLYVQDQQSLLSPSRVGHSRSQRESSHW